MKNIGDGKKRIGSRVLNALGGIQGHSEVLNDPVRIGRMRERAELMKSLESIRENNAVAEVNKKNEDLAEVLPDLPAAVERFKKGENVDFGEFDGPTQELDMYIGYNTDIGFKFGGLVSVYDYGKESTYQSLETKPFLNS